MANITIRNIPDDVYAALKESAERNRRSINNEVICLVEEAVSNRRLDPQYAISRAREVRALTADHPITIDELMDAIDEDRP